MTQRTEQLALPITIPPCAAPHPDKTTRTNKRFVAYMGENFPPPERIPSHEVALVGCSKMKAERPDAACRLYSSPLADKAVRYAAALDLDRVYFVSAQHGLLDLFQVIEPYDKSIEELSSSERDLWARRIVDELVIEHGPQVRVVLLCGAKYARPIERAARLAGLKTYRPYAFTAPIGRRLHLLNEALEHENNIRQEQDRQARELDRAHQGVLTAQIETIRLCASVKGDEDTVHLCALADAGDPKATVKVKAMWAQRVSTEKGIDK